MQSMQQTYNQLQDNRQLLSKLISSLQKVNRKLAAAEEDYRRSMTKWIFLLKQKGYTGKLDGEKIEVGPCAWTVSNDLARGIPEVAELRMERDTLEGEKDAILQKIYQVKIELRLLEEEMASIQKGE